MSLPQFALGFAIVIQFASSAVGQDDSKKSTNQTERLDQILSAWEARSSKIVSFRTKCRRTVVNPLNHQKTVFLGELAFLKPDMVRMEFYREDEAEKKDAKR